MFLARSSGLGAGAGAGLRVEASCLWDPRPDLAPISLWLGLGPCFLSPHLGSFMCLKRAVTRTLALWGSLC